MEENIDRRPKRRIWNGEDYDSAPEENRKRPNISEAHGVNHLTRLSHKLYFLSYTFLLTRIYLVLIIEAFQFLQRA